MNIVTTVNIVKQSTQWAASTQEVGEETVYSHHSGHSEAVNTVGYPRKWLRNIVDSNLGCQHTLKVAERDSASGLIIRIRFYGVLLDFFMVLQDF